MFLGPEKKDIDKDNFKLNYFIIINMYILNI